MCHLKKFIFVIHRGYNIFLAEIQFKIPSLLPKQDMIALPDLFIGAMENWGLITSRETLLLYKKGQSSAGQKELSEIVIAHEISHQWFGNLVTMEWWTE